MKIFVILVLLATFVPSAATAQQISDEDFLNPHFDDWPPCWFIATSTDFGLLYLRPRVSFGWGKPHTSWVGLDINPVLSITAPGGYTGFRLSLPHFDFRIGTRASYSLKRSALEPKSSYEEDEVFIRPSERLDPRSAYVSGEAEITTDFRLGPGSVINEFAATYIGFAPKDRYVFEERLRIVTDPPWILKARLGYSVPFDVSRIKFSIQPAGEILFAHNRPDPTVRAGLLLNFKLAPRLSVRANFLTTATSPDRIGFTGNNFGEITLRWRWARSIAY